MATLETLANSNELGTRLFGILEGGRVTTVIHISRNPMAFWGAVLLDAPTILAWAIVIRQVKKTSAVNQRPS